VTTSDPAQVLRTLKIAAYVERVLEAAEGRLSSRPWWNQDVERLVAAVRSVALDELAAVTGTWAGLKWLDAAENLRAAEWLADTYPGYAPACLGELSGLLLNYGASATHEPLPIEVPRSGVLFTHGNTRVTRPPRTTLGTRVYWSRDPARDTIAWSDADGRAIAPDDEPVAQIVSSDGRTAVPIVDDRARFSTIDADTRQRLTEYVGRLPDAVLELVHEGRGLVAVSDIDPGSGDSRPALLVRPEDLATDEYRHVARQLGLWLGAEFVRLSPSAPARGELAQMAVGRACTTLEASARPSAWMWQHTVAGQDDVEGNPLRRAVHAAVAATLDALAGVVQPMPLSTRAVALLVPFNAAAAMKTRHNSLLPANWSLIDHVSALEAAYRQHVVRELARGRPSEGEHYVIAACLYADARFADALAHAQQCLRLDPDCMEYHYLAAFCERHLGETASFEARVFGDPPEQP
jgi:hypothetical protein